MTSLRIAVASSGLGHVARGVESWAADLGDALAGRGFAVTLFKGGGVPASKHEVVISCLQRESATSGWIDRWISKRGRWRLGLGTRYDVEQTTFAVRLIRYLRRQRFAILHVQDPMVARLAQQASQIGLIPTRVILANGVGESRNFLSKMTYLQHLAPWHLEEAKDAGCWRSTWTAIPNFIDTDVYHAGRGDSLRDELGIPRDALVVTTASALRRTHKRIDYLLKEFARLRELSPDLPVWLIIAGGWDEDAEGLISEGKALLGDRVHFLVRFPRERMPDLYRASDIFVLCSLMEMLGIVLLEASASGIPCLVHNYPVLEWVVGPGGLTIDMDRQGVLSEAMAGLLASADRRRELGELARRHCMEHFSKDRVLDQILEYYDFVMKNPEHNSPSRQPQLDIGV